MVNEDKKLSKEELKTQKEYNKRLKKKMRMQKKEIAKEARLYTFRNWVKEIKRVVWPRNAKSWKWFGITIAFLIIMALFCFLVSLAFTSLWNSVGIKI
ncbi:preprotein translocase subunit SecE [Metamycoplasma auris]|uniref:Preprotein translocase subunit SecE n=1 Tax=Metamycoplasma auris TaxID=51363 RepID=A0A2W7FZR4_9BACT|nr:preprotein translocase subunit SecE [Metamycoplasma auris]PZV99811.1 preprotein translocase subunit SecE [Metamycoplasma auris]